MSLQNTSVQHKQLINAKTNLMESILFAMKLILNLSLILMAQLTKRILTME
jgi:hypothetical protein